MATKRKKSAKKKTKSGGRRPSAGLGGQPRIQAAVRKAAEVLWGNGVAPHVLLKELHDVLLLRCLREADGNYAVAAEMFGPSRQSIQQYVSSNLRDERFRAYQHNRRKNT